MSTVVISNLSFSYPEQSYELFSSLSLSFDRGWSAFVGANGSGKSTLASLIAGELVPDAGAVHCLGSVFVCPQLFSSISLDDYEHIYDYSASAMELKRRLCLTDSMYERTESLSGGERKRLQLFLALMRHPSILILDEPTNHLEEDNKAILLSALRSYEGCGIVISHDRSFLDALAGRTLVFSRTSPTSPVHIDDIPLPCTKALDEIEARGRSAMRERSAILSQMAAVKDARSQVELRIASSRSRLSKRGLDVRDHSGKGRIDAARISGKDRRDGDRKKALDSRIGQLAERLDSIASAARRKSGLDGRTLGTVHSALIVEKTVIRAGEYSLDVPRIELAAGSRTAVTGANGSGKSLLCRHLYRLALERWGEEAVAYLPQEYSKEDMDAIIAAFDSLDDSGKARVASDIYRLGGDVASYLDAEGELSPGEMRKLDILLTLELRPAFIIMDEPTNHLDITAVMGLESLLSEKGPTLVVVSHDRAFRQRLCTGQIELTGNGRSGCATIVS